MADFPQKFALQTDHNQKRQGTFRPKSWRVDASWFDLLLAWPTSHGQVNTISVSTPTYLRFDWPWIRLHQMPPIWPPGWRLHPFSKMKNINYQRFMRLYSLKGENGFSTYYVSNQLVRIARYYVVEWGSKIRITRSHITCASKGTFDNDLLVIYSKFLADI